MKSTKMLFLVVLLLTAATPTISLSEIPDSTSQSKIKESYQLTIQAQDELNRHNFDSAMNLIQKAIKLNPSNEKAKGLYVNLREFIRSRQQIVVKKQDTKNGLVQTKPSSTPNPDKNEEPEKIGTEIPEKNGVGYLQFGLQYSFGSSNYLDYINSSVQMVGGRIEGGYFFGKNETTFGFSADYSWYPLKIKGNTAIDITIHKMDAFLCGRTSFFPQNDQSLIVGIRAGYHYFLLQNNKNEGVYYFRQVAGPAVGLYFADPFFSRIMDFNVAKSFGLCGGLNLIPLIDNGIKGFAMEYNIDLTYRASDWQFSLGWRSYQIDNGKVKESFSDIEVATQYRF